MADQIMCTTKSNDGFQPRRIERVAGVRADGTKFNISREECASDILTNAASYCVIVDNIRTIVIGYEEDGKKYITTIADATVADNLLNLPDC